MISPVGPQGQHSNRDACFDPSRDRTCAGPQRPPLKVSRSSSVRASPCLSPCGQKQCHDATDRSPASRRQAEILRQIPGTNGSGSRPKTIDRTTLGCRHTNVNDGRGLSCPALSKLKVVPFQKRSARLPSKPRNSRVSRSGACLTPRCSAGNVTLLVHTVAPAASEATGVAAMGLACLIPASLVRLSSSALMATTAELPDIDSAAISGDSVKG